MWYAFSEPVWVLIPGVALAASCTAIIGTLSMLQKKSLAGDAISHALLPGLCFSFMLAGTKSPLWLMLGCAISGGLALLLIDYLPAHSKLKSETATALVLAVFFGFGLLLMTYIQHTQGVEQVGLKDFLLGNVASLMSSDIALFGVLSVVLLSVLLLLFKEWKLLLFDSDFATTIGRPVGGLQFLLQCLMILAIVIGVQTVGIVLMSAVLITPGAAARFWTNRLHVMLVLAVVFATLASALGLLASYRIAELPTGPCIVLANTCIAGFSFLFSPKKGLISKGWAQYYYKQKAAMENVLKLLYELGQHDGQYLAARSTTLLLTKRNMPLGALHGYLACLARQGLVAQKEGGLWALTAAGVRQGARILKLHLLWEAYLSRYIHVQPDHVHDDAEAIEHVLTPELEAELTRLVGDGLEVMKDE